jgi:hypothetical protein
MVRNRAIVGQAADQPKALAGRRSWLTSARAPLPRQLVDGGQKKA